MVQILRVVLRKVLPKRGESEKVQSWLESQQATAPTEIVRTSAALFTTMSEPNEKRMRNNGGVTTSHRQAPTPATKPEHTSEDEKKSDFSQLASSIAKAVRGGRLQITSKYLYKISTVNGSHNDYLAFKSAYIDTASSFS
ncbi:hypothetical protein EVAR_42907_1 [Eumeta japonica]|uniref:Uncharacterized protein n=1 Tax=Eumeta variegata TaxID=151549 RepID=A0A4C1WX74_EUMVA|nr:hypothetical protein EVAR_42907_1 [Eumeta japonica]